MLFGYEEEVTRFSPFRRWSLLGLDYEISVLGRVLERVSLCPLFLMRMA